MTNGEILKRVVEKAITNGYILYNTKLLNQNQWEDIAEKDYEVFIFSHKFAKAFWGKFPNYGLFFSTNDRGVEEYIKKNKNELIEHNQIPSWKFHLQQMILEKDPIKYLEQFI